MKMKKNKLNNFVAKHAQTCGAGFHVDKKGKNSPRCKQKASFKKEMKNYD